MKILATIVLFLGSALAAFSQTAVIKANSMTFVLNYQGTNFNVTGPSSDTTVPITLPAATAAGQVLTSTGANSTYTAQTPAAGSGLPSGLTFTGGSFNVTGNIVATGSLTATVVTLTGGSTLPTCASNLYINQYTAATNTLSPVCLPNPTITVSSPAANSFTFTAVN